jgi:hypothetical protein
MPEEVNERAIVLIPKNNDPVELNNSVQFVSAMWCSKLFPNA